jgi:hypothetical protein
MNTCTPSIETLFEQLGLSASESEISSFIQQHQLPEHLHIMDAAFWSNGQKQFLQERIQRDDDWAIVVDLLNTELHQDVMPKH